VNLRSIPVEAKRAIILQLLDELLSRAEPLPPESIAPRLAATHFSLPVDATTAPRSLSPAAANGASPPPTDYAGRSMSLREIIDIVE
jgi:hypothetical protein